MTLDVSEFTDRAAFEYIENLPEPFKELARDAVHEYMAGNLCPILSGHVYVAAFFKAFHEILVRYVDVVVAKRTKERIEDIKEEFKKKEQLYEETIKKLSGDDREDRDE